MVAQLSHDDHMILESRCIPEVMYGYANWGFDGELKCDRMRSSRIRLGPIRETEQVGEVLRGVSEVTLMGSKHG